MNNKKKKLLLRKQRTQRAIKVTLVTLTGLCLLLLLAPWLASVAPVRALVMRQVNDRIPGSLSVQTWSLSWWKPQRVAGILYQDAASALHAEVQEVTVDASLWDLLPPNIALGRVTVLSPLVAGRLPSRAPDTSPDRAPSPPPAPGGPPDPNDQPPLTVDADLVISNGACRLTIPDQPTPFELKHVNVRLMLQGAPGPVAIQGSAHQPGSGGVVQFSGALDAGALEEGLPLSRGGKFSLQARSLALAPLFGMLPPSDARPSVVGLLDADMTMSFSSDRSIDTEGQLQLSNLQLVGGPLGSDTPSFDRVRLDFDVSSAPQRVLVRQFWLESPIGTLVAKGRLDPDPMADFPIGSIITTGHVDVAALAAQLPETLRIQSGLRVTSGTLSMEGSVMSDGKALNGAVQLHGDNVQAIQDNRVLSLEGPVGLAARGFYDKHGLEFDSLEVTSSFAQIKGKGSRREFDMDGRIDLAAGMAELSKFIDVGNHHAAGTLDVVAQLRRLDETTARVRLQGTVQGLDVRGFSREPIKLDQFDLGGGATLIDAADYHNLEDVSLVVRCDFLSASFGAPAIVLTSDGRPAAITGLVVEAEGDLEKTAAFAERIGLGAAPVPLTGAAQLSAAVTWTPGKGLHIPSLKVTSDPLDFVLSADTDQSNQTLAVSARGSLGFDAALLTPLASARLGTPVVLAGKESRDFSLAGEFGPEITPPLTKTDATAGLALAQLEAFGIEARDLEAALLITNALATVSVDTGVNGGRLRLAPMIDLSVAPPSLSMPSESMVLQDITVTGKIANQLLGAIHPVFKGCLVSSGRMDLIIHHLVMPLSEQSADKLDLAGTIRLRGLELGAGGLAGDVLGLFGQQNQKLFIESHAFQFRCRDGRVEPAPLVFTVDGLPVTFAGSIAYDGALQYSALVPVTRELVGKDVFPYLEGTSIRLPIGGTVDRPRISTAAFRSATRDLIKDASRNLIMKEGTKLLESFLKPPPKDPAP